MSGTSTLESRDGSGSERVGAPARTGRAALLRDAAVVALWFVVLGVLGALVWWRAVDLPQATRTEAGVVVEPVELVKQVAADGWYVVLALVGGLLSGVVLLRWRRRDPLLMVVLVVLGAGLAAVVMLRLGEWLGPPPETATLRGQPVGAMASLPLRLHAGGAAWTWPVASALGALVELWVLRRPEPEDRPSAEPSTEPSTESSEDPTGEPGATTATATDQDGTAPGSVDR